MKKISILIPAYNEEDSLPLLYEELCKVINTHTIYEWEVLFVNDGSNDNTLNLIKNLRANDNRICYVDLSRNFGKEAAMLAGFDYVSGDCAIILDADLQDPPHLIPQIITYWEEGYDDVFARRNSRGKESWLRKKLSLYFYRILQKTTARIEILHNVGDFRLLDRKCINVLMSMREKERYTKGLYSWIGFKKKEFLFDRADRTQGKSSWNFWGLFRLAIDGITSFTVTPLHISTFIGILVSLTAFVYMIFILAKTLIFGDPIQGFTTLMVTILFLGGVQLLSLGVIGEYLGRIFNETKNRPTYIIREYEGTDNNKIK